jgi:hypothetical protein
MKVFPDRKTRFYRSMQDADNAGLRLCKSYYSGCRGAVDVIIYSDDKEACPR